MLYTEVFYKYSITIKMPDFLNVQFLPHILAMKIILNFKAETAPESHTGENISQLSLNLFYNKEPNIFSY